MQESLWSLVFRSLMLFLVAAIVLLLASWVHIALGDPAVSPDLPLGRPELGIIEIVAAVTMIAVAPAYLLAGLGLRFVRRADSATRSAE